MTPQAARQCGERGGVGSGEWVMRSTPILQVFYLAHLCPILRVSCVTANQFSKPDHPNECCAHVPDTSNQWFCREIPLCPKAQQIHARSLPVSTACACFRRRVPLRRAARK